MTISNLDIERDVGLVEAMARGDQRAAAALYDQFGAMLFGLALRIAGEAADAEEIVLDALAQAWREASRYDRQRATVAGWLTTITRTRALDLVRSRGRRARMADTAAQASVDEPLAMSTPAVDAATRVEHDERRVAVHGAMDSLPDPQRRVIELAFYEGLTHSEIATRLSEPLGTIKTRIRLGMLKLREALGGIAMDGLT